MENTNFDKKTYNNSVKKLFVIILIIAVIFGGYYASQATLLISDTFTDGTVTIKAPISFEKIPEDAYYYNEDADMFLNWYYIDKENKFTLDEMMPMVFSYWFSKGEYAGEYEVTVDGRKAYQMKYKCLQQAQNEVHYYYSGFFTVVELENRFLIVDINYKLSEEDGINKDISDTKIKLIKEMVSTIEINDNTAEFADAAEKIFELEGMEIILSEDWTNTTEEGEFGESESGKYVYLRNNENVTLMQYSYSYENAAIDIEQVKLDMLEPQYAKYYTVVGEDTLAGEPCIICSYSHLESVLSDSYVCGVFAMSEHYFVDIYFYTALEETELSQETQEVFIKTILNQ